MENQILPSRIITKNNLDSSFKDASVGLVFLIDKPLTWTSFDVVNKLRFALRHATGEKKIKVGHAGTLDPLATGLLIVCVGKYTKLIDNLTAMTKAYTAQVKFGATTASYDAECEEENILTDLVPESNEVISNSLSTFTGPIEQVPPIYSAIKINGKEAYKIARAGKDVEMKPRPVTISDFRLLQYDAPNASFFIDCSKGTYIRSLAHDLGQVIGCGAYLTSLERVSIGDYKNESALSMDQAVHFIENNIVKAG